MTRILIPETLTRYAYNKAINEYFAQYGGFTGFARKFNFIGESELRDSGKKIAECYRLEKPASINDAAKVDPFQVIIKPIMTRKGYAPEIKSHWLRINTYAEAVRQNEICKSERGKTIGNIKL